jgi:hypothetical protein
MVHIYKEYWGEGSNRARNWQRYDLGGAIASFPSRKASIPMYHMLVPLQGQCPYHAEQDAFNDVQLRGA